MKELLKNLVALQTLEFGKTPNKENEAAIAGLRGKIPPQILGHYDRLMVRGKKGIVAVQKQVCTACHMKLTLGIIMTLKHGTDIQLCESCGRYLYLPEGYQSEAEAAAAAEEAKPKKTTRRRAAASPKTPAV